MYASNAPPPPPPPPPRPPRTSLTSGSYIHQYQHQFPTPWSSGLFDCCDDKSNCLLTLFCPCVTFGKIAEIVDRGSISCGASGAIYALICCVTGWACLYSCCYRSKMRKQYNLEERPCADCLVHCCCESCALCQEYRHLKRIEIGREVKKAATMAPIVEERMSR